MALRDLGLRFLCLLTLAVWVGGFTFYSSVVIRALHASLGSMETGYVTQQVTDYLNAIGVATVTVWAFTAWVERSVGSRRARLTRLVLLATTSGLLLALILLHRVMDLRLDTGGLRGFYPLHRAYLIVCTAQWVANLGLLAVSLLLWTQDAGPGRSRSERLPEAQGPV
jgi:hypothetical protein